MTNDVDVGTSNEEKVNEKQSDEAPNKPVVDPGSDDLKEIGNTFLNVNFFTKKNIFAFKYTL